MPIFIVNPARRKAAKKRTPVKGSIRRVSIGSKGANKPSKRKTAARKTAITNPQGKKKMANKRRRPTAAQKRAAAARRRRRKRNPPPTPIRKGPVKRKKKDPKRVAAGKKGYKAGIGKKRAAAKKRKASSKPKKRTTTKKRTAASKRRRASRKMTTSQISRRRRYPKGKRRKPAARYASYGLKGLKRSRRKIKKAKKRPQAWRTRRYMKRTGMLKVNPSNGMMSAVKQVLPIAGSFYVSRLVVNKLGDIPTVSDLAGKLPMGLGKPVLSGVVMAVTHYGTKKGALSKYRTGLMLGTALAFVDSLISALAPADVKAMMGMGDYGSLGEYVPTSEYVSSGEYVSTGDVFAQEHGASLYDDPHGLYAVDGLHEIHAIHGIDQELGAIEAGVDTGASYGIFSSGW